MSFSKHIVTAMAAMGMFNPVPSTVPLVKPTKKCLLPECSLTSEPGKLFCGKVHTGEFKKRERAERKKGKT